MPSSPSIIASMSMASVTGVAIPVVSESFATYFGPWYSITDIAPLTTIFTYRSECIDRWYAETRAGEIVVLSPFSDFSRSLESSWSACQPLGHQTAYSPGVCPSHLTLIAITADQLVASNTIVRRWSGQCYPRYHVLEKPNTQSH